MSEQLRCPNCRGYASPGARRRVRGVFWCLLCSRNVQHALHGRSTAELARVSTLNRAELTRVRGEAPGVRIETADDVVERNAIVTFMRRHATTRRGRPTNKHAWGQRELAFERLRHIADGIERDQLSRVAALARLDGFIGTVPELLDEALRYLRKGIRIGKHRAASPVAPLARIAPPQVRFVGATCAGHAEAAPRWEEEEAEELWRDAEATAEAARWL